MICRHTAAPGRMSRKLAGISDLRYNEVKNEGGADGPEARAPKAGADG